ncbi:MAG TPA: lipopolysaccharide biosynthesis protein, partial [Thermodesulfobacteriota bacterium]|nr:lipopolysaccharide biosynthesis protein [Thermodesulfobacteriota bacterium]
MCNPSGNRDHTGSTRHLLDGAARVFLSESLIIPTGLVTTIFLTRSLGPESYGIYGLAVGIVVWIEFSICNIFGGTSIKFIGEADNWEPIAVKVLRLYIFMSAAAATGLWLLSGNIASLLGAPKLGAYLSLLAIDIPIFVLSTAHRQILVGRGKFKERAMSGSVRWLSRMALIVLLVEAGLSAEGAIIGIIISSLIELIINRSYVRVPILKSSDFPLGRLWGYVTPLFFFAIGMRLYDKLDLLFVKALGGTAEQAGIYVAAQNLSLIPSLFALSLSPLLLSTVSKAAGGGNKEEISHIISTSYRVVTLLFPLTAIISGCSQEVVDLIFGSEYGSSAPLLSILIFGSIATLFISVNYSVLTASGKPGLPLTLAGPIVPISALLYFLVIPSFGMIGASFIYTSLAWAGALATLTAVYYLWSIYPPATTVLK